MPVPVVVPATPAHKLKGMKLKIGGGSINWVEELSNLTLPFTLRYKFKIKEDCQLIPHYSVKRSQWGQGNEEGLTWFHATNRCDFTFRTEVFRSFPEITTANTFTFEKNKSYKCKVEITQTGASYWINDKLYGKCNYSADKVLPGGTVGFWTWENISHPCVIKNLKLNEGVDSDSGSDSD